MIVSKTDVTWRGGSNNSVVVRTPGVTLCGLYIPAGFAGTSVKILTTYDPDNVAGSAVADSTGAADLSVTVSAGRYIPLDYTKLVGVEAFQLQSSTTEAANTIVRAAVRVMK